MGKIAYVALILIVILLVSGCAQKQESQEIDLEKGSYVVDLDKGDQTPQQENTVEGITKDELAIHNSKNDCWIAYNSQVYDITDWLPRHPGSSAAIEPYCGTTNEFKQAFEGQHGTSKIKKLIAEGTEMGSLAE